jgi:protein MpaA
MDRDATSAPLCVGRSSEGRSLVVDRFGRRGPRLLIVSAIHGNERSAVAFAERLRARLLGGWAEQRGVRVALIAAANPDGIEQRMRANARGIDLNRNFPTDNFQPGGAGGDISGSEPETRALVGLIEAIEPDAVVSIHCCEPMLDHDGEAHELARTMHEAMPAEMAFPVETLGSQPGSMGSWVGLERETPIVTLEFAAADALDLFEQFDAAERALSASTRWLRDDVENEDDESVVPWPPLDRDRSAPHVGAVPTTSGGGLPIRLESTRPVSEIEEDEAVRPLVLLGGIGETDLRSLHVTEHLRRIAHVQLLERVAPVVTVSSLAPDGGVEGAPTDGVPPEIESWVFELVERLQPRLVVGIEIDAQMDSFGYRACDDRPTPASWGESELTCCDANAAWMETALDRGGEATLRIGVHSRCAEGRRAPGSIVSPDRFGGPFRAMLRS